MKRPILFLLMTLLPISVFGSAFSDGAAAMAVRSFKTLQITGLAQDQIPTRTDYRCLFRDANNGVYNPVTQEIMFIGAPKVNYFKWVQADGCLARDTGKEWSFLKYDTKNDTIISGVLDPLFVNGAFDGATYDRLVIDPVSGAMYFCAAMNKILKYDAGTWSSLSPTNGSGLKLTAAAYFPEMSGIAGVTDTGAVWLYEISSNQWRSLGAITGGSFKLAEYNPVLHAVLLTGGRGSYGLWKLEASGSVTALNNSPFQLDVSQSLLTCDPASGDYLVLRYDSLYAFDMTAQVWAAVKQTPAFPNFSAQKAVAVSLAGSGVVTFLTALPWPVILYKHGSTIAVEKGSNLPTPQMSMNCRPNPFNPESQITYSTSVSDYVNLSVYDVNGRVVKTLVSEFINAGQHSAAWNGSNAEGLKVSGGIYLVKVSGKYGTVIRRISLIR